MHREEKKYDICKINDIRLLRIKEGDFIDFSNVADKVWYIPKKYDCKLLDFYITEFLKFLTFYSDSIPSVNVKRDKNKILEYKTLVFEKSLLYLYPEFS